MGPFSVMVRTGRPLAQTRNFHFQKLIQYSFYRTEKAHGFESDTHLTRGLKLCRIQACLTSAIRSGDGYLIARPMSVIGRTAEDRRIVGILDDIQFEPLGRGHLVDERAEATPAVGGADDDRRRRQLS